MTLHLQVDAADGLLSPELVLGRPRGCRLHFSRDMFEYLDQREMLL